MAMTPTVVALPSSRRLPQVAARVTGCVLTARGWAPAIRRRAPLDLPATRRHEADSGAVDHEDWEWERLAELGLFPSLPFAEAGIDGPWDPGIALWRSRARPVDLQALHRLVPDAEELDLLETAEKEATAAETADMLAWMSWPDTKAAQRVSAGQPEHLESEDWPYGSAEWQGRPGIDRPHLHVEQVERPLTQPQAEALVIHLLGGEVVAVADPDPEPD